MSSYLTLIRSGTIETVQAWASDHVNFKARVPRSNRHPNANRDVPLFTDPKTLYPDFGSSYSGSIHEDVRTAIARSWLRLPGEKYDTKHYAVSLKPLSMKTEDGQSL